MENLDFSIAYFSAEIGISASLPTYSGGLGILAGDHIKAAADIGLPLVGITLLYKEGYFKQTINLEGIQKEVYPKFDPLPKLKKISKKFSIHLNKRDIWIQAYEYLYKGLNGHISPVYFLDTDLDENHENDRIISLRLYSGDKNHRILQEAILGFGGVDLLNVLGFKNIKTYHMNEGHCSFLTLSLLKKYNGDHDKVKSMCHFTTHTPVDAGHDHFSIDRCRALLDGLIPSELPLPSWNKKNRLHMTELGLHFSRSANGVSKLHGKIAQDQFPKFNINYVTNGVYHPFWLGRSFKALFDKRAPGWQVNPDLLLNLDNVSDSDLISAHYFQKKDLLDYVNSQTQKVLSNDILTIGFARRAAEYKRARLIFSDLERLKSIGENKLQIIFAGKAHPKDSLGKSIIKSVIEDASKLFGSIKIVYLENYNIWLGHLITSGVDVWLNTPLRPNEASGTSGMKASLNGIPNLSILDGWWAEGCRHGENGWAIGSSKYCDDKSDSESLYKLLEDEVMPTFYDKKDKWIEMIRKSITTSVDFTAHRMILEYKIFFYKS